MTTTAWRFRGTEGADEAVLRLKKLDSDDLINVQDVAVVRWPQYAGQPTAQEHVTEERGKMASLVRKVTHPVIDKSLIETVKHDITPGNSAMVLLSRNAEMGPVAKALQGLGMELIRSDLFVSEEDLVRAAFGASRGGQQPSQG